MRFLLRLAFWLSVVVILLPRSESQPPSGTQVSASEAVAAASATIGDMAKFCDRQPDACTVGTQAAEALGDRARDGAKRLYEILNERLVPTDRITATAAPQNARSIPLPPARPSRSPMTSARNAQPVDPQAASQNTLTPADLAPLWRGPLPRKDPREPA